VILINSQVTAPAEEEDDGFEMDKHRIYSYIHGQIAPSALGVGRIDNLISYYYLVAVGTTMMKSRNELWKSPPYIGI
jgi:hypothetical protein